MLFQHIAIVGVGLIGGSFALAARRYGLAARITGWDEGASLERALSLRVIDDVETSFEAGRVCEADLIYLAAPVGGIIDFLRAKGKLIKPGAVVTDAGSAKREICLAARESLLSETHFIGGHPMAGSHQAGVEFASAELFQNAPYTLIVEPDEEIPSMPLKRLAQAVEAIGGRPVFLTAEEHDRLVARMSHVPQLLATSLVAAVAKKLGAQATALAGGGFFDMTRIAGSRWSVWEDICRANADEIAAGLDEIIAEIEAVRAAVESGDFSSLRESFRAANDFMRYNKRSD